MTDEPLIEVTPGTAINLRHVVKIDHSGDNITFTMAVGNSQPFKKSNLTPHAAVMLVELFGGEFKGA